MTPDAKEIQLEKNFACLKCKNIPIAPVQQCQSCDALYCDFCNTQIMNEKPEPVVEEKKEEKPEVKPECEQKEKEDKPQDAQIEENKDEKESTPVEPKKKEKKTPEPKKANACCNKKCKSDKLVVKPIGRILRNVMSCFTFKHEGVEENLTYEPLIKHITKNAEKLKCPVEGCKDEVLKTKEQLKDHLTNYCACIKVTCKMCETEFARGDLDNKEKHYCQKILKQKLDETRANVAKTEKELAQAKANTENEKRRQEDLKRANDDYKRRIENLEKRVKESEEQEAEAKKKV